MKDTKLLRALSTLDKEEWMSFRKFILTNTGDNSEIYSLFAILQSRKLNYPGLKTPEKFRIKYYPSLSQKAFFAMQSKLYKWLEEWLGIYEFHKAEYEKDLYIIKGLFRKGLIKEGKSLSRKLKIKIETSSGLDFKRNKILGEIDHFLYYEGGADTIEERNQLLLSASIKNALSFKESSQFHLVELANRSSIYNVDFSGVQKILSESIGCLNDTEISEYGSFLKLLIENSDPEMLEKLQSALLNGTFKQNSGLEELVADYLAIYSRRLWSEKRIEDIDSIIPIVNIQLQRLVDQKGGKIPHIRFHNAVDFFANFITVDKATEFLEKWIEKVETKNLKETKDLAYSQIHFIRRDFEKMFEFSRFIAFDNSSQRTRAWLHNIICQYVFRKENYDGAVQSLSSFKKYLKRNKKKISKNFYKANINVVLILEKLMKNDFKPQEIDLENYKQIIYRNWITQEVEKSKRK